MTSHTEPATSLRSGQIVPSFALTDMNGEVICLKSYKQRRPVLFAFLHSVSCPECRAWLAELAAARDDLTYRNVLSLLIFPEVSPATLRAFQQEPGYPGKVLADPGHTTLARYIRMAEPTDRPPAVLVAVGRYNELLDMWSADEPSQWPSLRELMTTFAFAEQEDCACGLPAWPED